MPPTYSSPLYPSLCSRGLTRLIVTGVLVQWLRQHFATADRLESPELALPGNEFVWSDSRESKLLVESTAVWDPSQTEQRPALLVKPLGWRKKREGVDDRMIPGPIGGWQHYATFWVGAHRVMALSGAEAEAELLAGEAWSELDKFAPVVRRAFGFKRFEATELGEYGQLEEARKNYGIPITVTYAVEQHWRIDPSAPVLKAFNIDLTVRGP